VIFPSLKGQTRLNQNATLAHGRVLLGRL